MLHHWVKQGELSALCHTRSEHGPDVMMAGALLSCYCGPRRQCESHFLEELCVTPCLNRYWLLATARVWGHIGVRLQDDRLCRQPTGSQCAQTYCYYCCYYTSGMGN